MAKITIDSELVLTLTTLRKEIEGLEDDWQEREKKLEAVAQLKNEQTTITDKLTAKRTQWDTLIADVPKDVAAFLAVPRIRSKIAPKQSTTPNQTFWEVAGKGRKQCPSCKKFVSAVRTTCSNPDCLKPIPKKS